MVSYARVLVEVDVSKEVKRSVDIVLPNGELIQQKVHYENLPQFCSGCKRVGHSVSSCSLNKQEETKKTDNAAVAETSKAAEMLADQHNVKDKQIPEEQLPGATDAAQDGQNTVTGTEAGKLVKQQENLDKTAARQNSNEVAGNQDKRNGKGIDGQVCSNQPETELGEATKSVQIEKVKKKHKGKKKDREQGLNATCAGDGGGSSGKFC